MRDLIRSVTVVAAVLVIGAPLAVASCGENHAGTEKAAIEPGDVSCEKAMAAYNSMAAKRSEADRRLEEMVAAMNAASGDEKMELMAKVINELVKQRSDMHRMMDESQPLLMGHAVLHAHGRGDHDCPMTPEQEPDHHDEDAAHWGN